MHTHRIVTACLLFISIFGIAPTRALAQPAPLVLAAPEAPSTTRAYPGAAPCNTTLQACISASADGDTVLIAAGTYVTSSLSITRAVSLIGNGASPSSVKLRPSSGRMIQYDAASITASTVISNMTIENGNAGAASGGGIRVASGGAPLFHSLVISNNTSIGGGGIRIIPTVDVTLTNVTLFSNTASGNGGGISTLAGKLTLLNSQVLSNSTGTNGGGISSGGPLVISNTLILTNTASGSGGGIFGFQTVNVVRGSINKNKAAIGGGLFVATGMNLTLEGGTNSINRLTMRDNAATAGNGGGAHADGPVKIFGDTLFANNTATGEGGALYVHDLTDDFPNTIVMSWATNTSGGHGGAVRALGTVNLCPSRPQFLGNHAGDGTNADGGGIYADGAIFLCGGGSLSNANTARFGGAYYSKQSVTLNAHDIGANSAQSGGCVFSEGSILFNSADANGCKASADGGAANGITVTIQGNGVALFQNNTAGGAGGVARGVVISISNATLFSNTAATGGAASATDLAQISSSSFTSNTAQFDGGAAESGSRILVTSSVFATNRVTNSGSTGGALFAPTLVITGGSFVSNTAVNAGSGGAAQGVFITATNAAFTANRATNGGAISATTSLIASSGFTSNVALAKGGGMFGASSATIQDSRFFSNTAISCCSGEGGGAWLNSARIERSYFENNQADDEGAGAYISNTAVVSESQFIHNTDGIFYTGASALRLGKTSLVVNSVFDGNRDTDTSDGGGAIDSASNSTSLRIYDSTFNNNIGEDGGAVRSLGSNAVISNATFYNNVSECCGQGGAVNANSISIYSSQFISNYADCCGGGGAIFTFGALFVQDSRFVSNTVEERMRGGAIHSEGSLFVSGSAFLNNSVVKAGSNNTGQGGAIYTFVDAPAYIENSIFQNNRANHGGAITCDYRCEVLTSRFDNNVADQPDSFTFSNVGTGGAIQAAGDLVLQRSRFARNSAGVLGGAVYQNRARPLLVTDAVYENNLFVENTAQNSVFGAIGNAVVISGTVSNGKFLFNTVVSDALTANSAVAIMSGTVSVLDNIFTNHALALQRGAPANVFENFNMFSGNTANLGAGILSGGNSFNAAPLFVSPALDVYHLKPGSPGIDAGTDVLVYVDYDGQTRPQDGGFDIGFDEGGLPRIFVPNTMRAVSAGW